MVKTSSLTFKLSILIQLVSLQNKISINIRGNDFLWSFNTSSLVYVLLYCSLYALSGWVTQESDESIVKGTWKFYVNSSLMIRYAGTRRCPTRETRKYKWAKGGRDKIYIEIILATFIHYYMLLKILIY